MQTALDTFTLHPSLLYRLWRIIAIRVATPLMLEQIAFQVCQETVSRPLCVGLGLCSLELITVSDQWGLEDALVLRIRLGLGPAGPDLGHSGFNYITGWVGEVGGPSPLGQLIRHCS